MTNEEFDYADSYWFSYITTTTVGLGDYYLEPEVYVVIQLAQALDVVFMFSHLLPNLQDNME